MMDWLRSSAKGWLAPVMVSLTWQFWQPIVLKICSPWSTAGSEWLR